MKPLTKAINLLLHGIHLFIIIFSVIGWMIPALRPYHLLLCLLIAFSWFVLGARKGWGYCLVTDWQWHLMRHMGITDLPSSYMPMLYRFITGHEGNNQHIELTTKTVFYFSFLASVAVNREFIRELLIYIGQCCF
ncbi:MAG: DUF2784 family protein [Gammaproteobacteria bacterium]